MRRTALDVTDADDRQFERVDTAVFRVVKLLEFRRELAALRNVTEHEVHAWAEEGTDGPPGCVRLRFYGLLESATYRPPLNSVGGLQTQGSRVNGAEIS